MKFVAALILLINNVNVAFAYEGTKNIETSVYATPAYLVYTLYFLIIGTLLCLSIGHKSKSIFDAPVIFGAAFYIGAVGFVARYINFEYIVYPLIACTLVKCILNKFKGTSL